MNILSCLLVALGLSMDNSAVTAAYGCVHQRRASAAYILRVSTAFTLAHFTMFSLGWLLGDGIGHYVGKIAPWIACAILVGIGGHMIKESLEENAESALPEVLSLKVLLGLAVATSIDAWMVGMGMGVVYAPFLLTLILMCVCVFITSWGGFYVGALLGNRFGRRVGIGGGIALMLVGVKVLLEGLGIW